MALSLIQCFATLIGTHDNTILQDLMIPEHAHDWDAESKPDFEHTPL